MSLKRVRKNARKGLEETARYMGISRQALNAWERGAYEPNASQIKRLSEFYGVSADELLRNDDEDGKDTSHDG